MFVIDSGYRIGCILLTQLRCHTLQEQSSNLFSYLCKTEPCSGGNTTLEAIQYIYYICLFCTLFTCLPHCGIWLILQCFYALFLDFLDGCLIQFINDDEILTEQP